MSASRAWRRAKCVPRHKVAVDYGDRWPDLTVNDGRRTLGYVFVEEDGSLTATSTLGGVLGNFPKRDGARLAIINAGARHG